MKLSLLHAAAAYAPSPFQNVSHFFDELAQVAIKYDFIAKMQHGLVY